METMTLEEKQQLLPYLLIDLYKHAYEIGYKITLGEAWRSPETCVIYEKEGKGISHSLHIIRLAQDINLWKENKLLSSYSDYKLLGDFWKDLSTMDFECCWGGDFKRPDCYHFSITHDGVR